MMRLMSVNRVHRLLGEHAQIGDGVAEVGERLRVEHLRPQIGDRGIQFFGRLVKALDETRRAARDLLKVERRLAFHVRRRW